MAVLSDARTDPSLYPLIVFVHIPKTGGTTVKEVLRLCSPRGNGNLRYADSSYSFVNMCRSADWISGHLPRDVMARSLIWLGRPIEYYSVVRDPVDQLISHLNFSLHRRTEKDYHDLHDDNEKGLDAEIAAMNFSDPYAIIDFLTKYPEGYLNIQSRLLIGEDFTTISQEEFLLRLQCYSHIATEFTFSEIFDRFGFCQLPVGHRAIRENVSVPYIDRTVFQRSPLREFLFYNHRHDARLYTTIMQTPWRVEARRSFRPSHLAVEAFTYDNFDEQAYLTSNPDVAEAVMNGVVPSGLAHFSEFGLEERRMVRRWIFPPA